MSIFLFWLTQFLPCRIISDGEVPYLERYYLCTFLGLRFYLHRFVGSDPARGLHDHPWRKAYSLILSGWYWEETRSGTRKVRWFNSLTGDTFHRVVLPDYICFSNWPCHAERRTAPCWTLFFHTAGDVKPWGFWRDLQETTSLSKGADAFEGAAYFQPYAYTREGNQKNWWLTAPKGREIIRS